MRTALGLSLVTLALASAARAADDENLCGNGRFAHEPEVRLGRITAPKGVDVSEGAPPCAPDEDFYCKPNAHLAAGTAVLVGRTSRGESCIFAVQSEDAGWAPTKALSISRMATAPPLSAWRGYWHEGDDLILLDPRPDGRLLVSGRAYWPARHVPPGNSGELNGQIAPQGDHLAVDDGDCHAEMRLAGPYLIVADNMRCGGMNVTFSGVYKRAVKGSRMPLR